MRPAMQKKRRTRAKIRRSERTRRGFIPSSDRHGERLLFGESLTGGQARRFCWADPALAMDGKRIS